MRIILDVPDTTLCAFVNYIFHTDTGMKMGVRSIQTEELSDGNVIKVEPYKGGEEE